MSYYTKITKTGLAVITAAMNSNNKVPISYMAFGDGNGSIPEPDENALSLVNEVYRTGVNKVEVHDKNPNWLVCEAIIPSAVGGFNIREVALFDNTGNKMLAIASYPPTYKPTVEEGAAKIQTIRIVLQVENTGNFELLIDPDIVLSTVKYVDNKYEELIKILPKKNYCWNGDFEVWQRYVGFNLTLRKHTADGWSFARKNFSAGYNVSQQLGSFGNYALRMKRIIGDSNLDECALVFNLSKSETLKLKNQKVALSLRAKCGQTYSAENRLITLQLIGSPSVTEQAIHNDTGNYSLLDHTLATENFVLDGEFKNLSLIAEVPSHINQIAIKINFKPVGSASNDNDFIDIEKVKLEPGDIVTSFTIDEFEKTLLIAQQQYCKSYSYGVVEGLPTYEGALRQLSRSSNANDLNFNIRFPVSMRAIPTISIYSPTGRNDTIYTGSSEVTASVSNLGTNGFNVSNAFNTLQNTIHTVHYTAEAAL